MLFGAPVAGLWIMMLDRAGPIPARVPQNQSARERLPDSAHANVNVFAGLKTCYALKHTEALQAAENNLNRQPDLQHT